MTHSSPFTVENYKVSILCEGFQASRFPESINLLRFAWKFCRVAQDKAITSRPRPRRASVSAESIAVDEEPDEPLPVYPKTEGQLQRIRAAITENFIFRDLDEEQETGVLRAMREVRLTSSGFVLLY